MTPLELDALYFSPGKWHGANDGEKLSGRHPPSVIQAVITGALITGSEISCIWRQAGYVNYCMLLCRQVLWNGSEINRFSFLPDGLFHNTITCITCGIVDDNLHDNSSNRHRRAKSLVLNIVSENWLILSSGSLTRELFISSESRFCLTWDLRTSRPRTPLSLLSWHL